MAIAKVLGKTETAAYMKVHRLGLRVEEESETNQLSSSSRSKLSGELPSIENVMKRLSAALKALEQPGIEKKEIIRLRCFIQGIKIYKEMFADYVHYREIETELVDLRQKYEEIAKKPRTMDPEQLATLIKTCGFLLQTKVYLFWQKP